MKDDVKEKTLEVLRQEELQFNIKEEIEPFSENEIYKAMQSQQDGDAWLFTQIYKDQLCYDHAAGKWYEWKGHYWGEDKIKEIIPKIDAVIDIYAKEASKWAWRARTEAEEGNKKEMDRAQKKEREFLKKIAVLQKENWKKDVLELATAGKRSLGIVGEEWDLDPWVLGWVNGVIDLQTGKFRDGKQSDYIKTICPTEWKGLNEPCLIWERFLKEIFNNDLPLISFVQRLFGYAITGLTTDHILPILWGQGWNGKGTLLETIAHTLGPLAGPIQAEMLLDQGRLRSSASPVSDIMALKGKRITWGSETDEGRKLNAGKVKWLVGGDTLCGREPYGKREITFKPTHTLFLLTNHRPRIDSNDYALWKRIHLVEFSLSFIDDPKEPNERKRDSDLPKTLKLEVSGILAWLIRGCLEWQKQGLNPPENIKSATQNYQNNEDDIKPYIDECCYKNSKAKVKAGALYDDYENWCKKSGIEPANKKRFSQYIRDRFDATPKTMTGTYYLGIGLIDKNEP